ncbi:MAG TPA: ABC transporter permease [Thermotogota bacterium]|nr:ABC transporter permease [Thermotogota bacterium]
MNAFIQHFLTEIKYIIRNPIFFVILIVTPFLLLTVSLMFIPTERALDDISIGVLGEDKTFLGKYLANFILGFLKQQNIYKITDKDQALTALDKGEIDGLIVIPIGFTANMLQGNDTYISYIPSSASLLESVTIFKLLRTALGEIEYGAMIEMNLDEKMTPSRDVKVPELRVEGIEHNTLDYPDVMAPGVLAFVILSTMLIGITGSVSREKDKGILDGFRVTPSSRLSYVLGKYFAHSILGLIQTISLLLGSIYILHINFEGSVLIVGFLLTIGMLTYLSLGLLISVFSPNSDVSMGIAAAIVFLMFLGGGVFFPLSQMPKIMQMIAPALPITVLTDVLRKLMIAGKPLGSLVNESIYLFTYLGSSLFASLMIFRVKTK